MAPVLMPVHRIHSKLNWCSREKKIFDKNLTTPASASVCPVG
jgi:hypothetical protein